MSERVAYFNGDFVSELKARVSIFGSALISSDFGLRRGLRRDEN